ncbi:MAG: hypothetical protein ACRC6G_10275 [Deefgea sp.]
MSHLRLKRDVTYGGAVTFVMVGYRPQKYVTAMYELADAMPTVIKTDEEGRLTYPNNFTGGNIQQFLSCVGHTIDIEFNLDETSPDALLNLKAWWTEIMPAADYKLAFQTFVGLLDADVINVWYGAIQAAKAVRPNAPSEMQPGAAAVSEADAGFTDGVKQS